MAKYLVPVSEQRIGNCGVDAKNIAEPPLFGRRTSESPFDRSCHVITQFFRSTRGSLDLIFRRVAENPIWGVLPASTANCYARLRGIRANHLALDEAGVNQSKARDGCLASAQTSFQVRR